MRSNSTPDKIYEITFPDGRKVRCLKIGPVEQAAIDTAVRFGERLVVTIRPEPSGQHMRQSARMDVAPSAIRQRCANRKRPIRRTHPRARDAEGGME